MSENRADLSRQSIDIQVNETVERGKSYASALLALDAQLSNVDTENDQAVGFDVGAGADAIAFKLLGFQRAVTTNSPSSTYQLLGQNAQRERETELALQSQFPLKTRRSDLAITDFLQRESFSPRLVTMLRMAPRYFGNDTDPSSFLRFFLPLAQRLKSNGLIVLSALNDHEASGKAFSSIHEQLEERNIPHQFFIDSQIPFELRSLGDRVLSISGKR